eukprot:gene21658-26048_t
MCYEPGHWTGTTELLNHHVHLGYIPVQYCQCFVYAGVQCTVARSLGLPARVVTTFQSAHDADTNRSIEKYYYVDEDGLFQPTEGPSHDSVWSFHVWNEVYMKRTELENGNGWQALDATPQEASAGGSGVGTEPVYQMGPASVRLLKRNEDPICTYNSDKKYGCWDNQFVISEVNSNVNVWTQEGAGWDLFGTFQSDPFGDVYNTIGLQISTKKKGAISADCLQEEPLKDCSADLDDLTSRYKEDEDSGPGDATVVSSRRRRANEDDGSDTTEVDANFTVGMWPRRDGPIVNVEGHWHSKILLHVNVTLPAPLTNATLKCLLTATMHDYTGARYRGSNNESWMRQMTETVPLGTSTAGVCSFNFSRDDYMEFAAEDMEASSKAYTVKVEVSAVVMEQGQGTVASFISSRSKMICTPEHMLRDSIVCEDYRGHWYNQEYFNYFDCAADLTGVGDGVCDVENNVDGCWDGGDCCPESCAASHGGLMELSSDSDATAAHSCPTNTSQCSDLRAIYLEYDYSLPTSRNTSDCKEVVS